MNGSEKRAANSGDDRGRTWRTFSLQQFLSEKRRRFYIGKALRLVWRSAPGWSAAGAMLAVIQGALPLASLYLVKQILDAIQAMAADADMGALFGADMLWLLGLMGGVSLFGGLVACLAAPIREAQAQAFAVYMYGVLHEKSVQADLAYYESPEYYDSLHRAQRDGPARPLSAVNSLVQLGRNTVSLGAMFSLLLSFHWAVACVLFLTAIPVMLVRLRFVHKLFRLRRKRTAAERHADYYHRMLTGVRHAKEIRLFGLGELFIRCFRDIRGKLRKEKIKLTARSSLAQFVVQTVTTLAVLFTYVLFVHQTVAGAITMGSLVMYHQAMKRGQGFLASIMSGLANLYENNLFLANLYEFLEMKPLVASPPDSRPAPRPMQHGIALENVRFRYPGSEREALTDVSLAIRPGEHIALVGENGSGKTTLIKLLCRLYDPVEGRIRMDDVDLRRYSLSSLRGEISVIFQDYIQYHMTARENIRLGGVDAPPDDERIMAAARLSGADDFIRELPKGYDNILGRRFKGGEELSIGQWQKVALARAFLRDAQIIVLDEPTSALDARAEFEVFQHFRELARGKMAILISHRFSTVKTADRIFVLDGGRIIESGAHEELVRLGGRYACLYDMQARSYH